MHASLISFLSQLEVEWINFQLSNSFFRQQSMYQSLAFCMLVGHDAQPNKKKGVYGLQGSFGWLILITTQPI